MGGFEMRPGATTPRDFARAPAQPHDPTRSSGYEVGEPWIDQGGHGLCHGRAGRPGCFLEDDQRAALITDLQQNVIIAAKNYQNALLSLRMDKLVEKEDDLSWVLMLALDLVGQHALATLTNVLRIAAKC